MVTSNIMSSPVRGELVFNYHDLAFSEEGAFDNSMVMLLRLLAISHVNRVSIAGFDGFQNGQNNYVDSYYKTKGKGPLANQKIKKAVDKLKLEMEIDFLTPSLFQ